MRASREARELIQDILEKLLTSYAPQKVILFGSYAYGTPRQDSDIDLLIIKTLGVKSYEITRPPSPQKQDVACQVAH